ncbi:MAG: preprotein translocase subunit SecG [Desulfovibrio sp.]|uniref:preprotein translocase subunit SecG n=1 Tax=Desulfovibrio sp. 7SRBS1 TaxID=3378064 RepID=UPI003B421E17
MDGLVLTIHIIACLILIVVVLLQSGKEGMGVIFGGGGGSVFGSSGAGGLLVKVTTVVAIIFLATSLTYNKLTGTKAVSSGSIMSDVKAVEEIEADKKEDTAKPKVLFEDAGQPASNSSN